MSRQTTLAATDPVALAGELAGEPFDPIDFTSAETVMASLVERCQLLAVLFARIADGRVRIPAR